MNAMLAGVLLWLGASVFDCTSADYEKTCTTEDFYQQPRGLCGPKLSNILALVCSQTGYNGYNKRAHDHSLSSAYFPLTRDLMDGGSKVAGADGTGDLQMPSRQHVFLPKASALSFLHDKRSVYLDGSTSQGIVCECCIHQCSMAEFRQYCAQPPK